MNWLEILDQNHMYICEHCSKLFLASDIKLVNAKENKKELIFNIPFTYIDKKNTLWFESGCNIISEGDMVMSCPHCNRISPSGFSKLIEVDV